MWVTTTGFKGSYRCGVGNRPGGAVIMTNVEHPDATVPDSVEVPRVGVLRYELRARSKP
jgi:hypothetical protein